MPAGDGFNARGDSRLPSVFSETLEPAILKIRLYNSNKKIIIIFFSDLQKFWSLSSKNEIYTYTPITNKVRLMGEEQLHVGYNAQVIVTPMECVSDMHFYIPSHVSCGILGLSVSVYSSNMIQTKRRLKGKSRDTIQHVMHGWLDVR